MTSASVGIVVVNYNGLECSCACIDSLLRMPDGQHSIILVDNGSGDGSGQKIREHYGDRIIYVGLSENGGVTRGNNAGIARAQQLGCTHVLFLNNDTEVEPDFLVIMLETSLKAGHALVVPKIVCAFDRARIDHWIGVDFDWWHGKPSGHRLYPLDGPEYDVPLRVKVASTCCLLVPLAVVEDVGAMDENYFMYYDDADFTLRASGAGHEIMYAPKARIYHKGAVTSSSQQPSLFQYYLISRNVFYFYRKLCPNAAAKMYYLTRVFISVLWSYVRAVWKRDEQRREVARVIIKDIFSGRTGGLPPELFRKKKHEDPDHRRDGVHR